MIRRVILNFATDRAQIEVALSQRTSDPEGQHKPVLWQRFVIRT